MNRIRSIIALLAVMFVSTLALTGCVGATTSAMCGWVQGNGSGTSDAKVHKIVYPNENANAGTGEVVKYVPCNSRNYIINDGSQKGVGGTVTGDSSTPVVAYTKDKTPVKVSLSAYWTLNEGKEAFTQFIALCQKYDCATEDTAAGGANFGTKGWNGMLAENFYPSIRAAVQATLPQFDNNVWENGGDTTVKSEFADAVSAEFMKQIAITTGYNNDLFCGSGNSRFTNDSHDTFTCTNVRFRIDNVVARSSSVQNNVDVQSQSDLITKTNQSRYKQSEPLYGKQTNYWLGVQDAVKGCPKGSTCNFYLRDPSAQQ